MYLERIGEQRYQKVLNLLSSLSFEAMGYSSPNPPVACVLTDPDGKILSYGNTQQDGKDHAERVAYKSLKGDWKNRHIVFVTLEPCSHTGRTPPCLDLVLENEALALYYGVSDPNPEVRKRDGLQECSLKGIYTESLYEIRQIALAFLKGFLSRIETGKPYCFFKAAVSKEGYYVSLPKKQEAISSPESFALSSLLRSKVDAVLVGPGTVSCDIPGLNYRKPDFYEIDDVSPRFFREEHEPPTGHLQQNIFYRELLACLKNKDSRERREEENYQPYRVFFLPKDSRCIEPLLNKQENINFLYSSKKAIFILPKDSNISRTQKERMQILSNFDLWEYSKDTLENTIYELGIKLKWNTVLLEGGNFLYSLFASCKGRGEFIQIQSQAKEIEQGLKPVIPFHGLVRKNTITLKQDTWSIYTI
ncbi:MAG: bifunctional diaminohydroxyphosphoribosylaminopyrimidine deaminase/5-amino-6-(5-phosphoribosylamino)uracil reductase [Leptospiraceae bacterium]|nr:bifunctional diaminohydroxyphosphoribosylaminopyrimidine deaminase/5-amino-6-(5-phosphoribosylamino)uracil reductase [Leptospiraceae bacterium]